MAFRNIFGSKQRKNSLELYAYTSKIDYELYGCRALLTVLTLDQQINSPLVFSEILYLAKEWTSRSAESCIQKSKALGVGQNNAVK